MSTGGPSGFGQGGMANYLPGRGYPEYGSNARDMPDDWVGGARGPAALPSRTSATVGNGPAPRDPRIVGFDTTGDAGRVIDGSGEQGPLPSLGGRRRAPSIEDSGAPRLYFDGVLGHGSIPWDRRVYQNAAGAAGFVPPLTLMSWSANQPNPEGRPRSHVPTSRKRIGSFTVRRPFGDTSSGELFRSGPLTAFVQSLQTNLQGRRWIAQSKTHSPTLLPRSVYAMAGSYGQTTPAAATAPSSTPAPATFGAY